MANRRSRQAEIRRLRGRVDSLNLRVVALERENELLRDRLNEWAGEVRAQLGDNSAFNEQVKCMQWAGGDSLRLLGPSNPVIGFEKDSGQRVDNSNILRALVRTVKVTRDEVKNQVRINLITGDGTLSYVVSDKLRRSIRDDKLLSRMVAREFARAL